MSALPLETALYRRSFDDGLLDVLVGIGLIAIGFSWIADLIPLGAIAPAILIPFWQTGRKQLIDPRLAHPKFRDSRHQSNRRSLVGWGTFGAGVLLAEIALFLYARQGEAPLLSNLSEVVVGLPMFLIGVGLLAGLMVGARRFVIYALISFAIGGIGIVAGAAEPGQLILALGLVVFATGGWMLVSFIRAYPLDEGVADV